jgi:hypothetical protein
MCALSFKITYILYGRVSTIILVNEITVLLGEIKISPNCETAFGADKTAFGIYFYHKKACDFISAQKLNILKQ